MPSELWRVRLRPRTFPVAPMRVTVKLFAVAKQRVGRSEIEIDVPDAVSLRHVRGALAEQFPALADVLLHSRLAVNNEYADDTSAVQPQSEIAVIPPVSGG